MAHHVDVFILGAGPAGINAAVEAHCLGLTSVIIEQKQVLNTIHAYYPKEKRVDMDYKGVKAEFLGKVHFPKMSYSLAEYTEVIDKMIAHHKLDIRVPENVESVKKIQDNPPLFEIKTDKETYVAKTVFIAIGMFAKPKRLEAEIDKDARKQIVYEIAGKDYANNDIAVYGGANSAIEIALNFYKRGNNVTIIYRGVMEKLESNLNTGNLDDLRAVLAEQEKNPKYKFRIDLKSQIVKATKNAENGKLHAVYDTGAEVEFDYCFVAIGGGSSRDFLEGKCGVKFTEKGAPIVDDNYESDNKGLYVIGDVSEKGKAAIVTAMKESVLATNHVKSTYLKDKIKEKEFDFAY